MIEQLYQYQDLIKTIGYVIVGLILVKLSYLMWIIFLRPQKDLVQRYGQNSWAVVTGGADGIGRAFSLKFGSMGFNVIMIDRNQKLMDETAKDILKSNPHVKTHMICIDFNSMNIEMLSKSIEQSLTSKVNLNDISVLVNNVGTLMQHTLDKCTIADITRQVQVNVYPMLIMSNLLLPHMLQRQNRSCIVSVASMAGMRPIPGPIGLYSATKAFISFMNQSLAQDFGYKIDFHCLHPNIVSTDMTNHPKTSSSWYCIMPKTCVDGLVREIGYPGMIVSSGPWRHKLINFYLCKLISNKSFKEWMTGVEDVIRK